MSRYSSDRTLTRPLACVVKKNGQIPYTAVCDSQYDQISHSGSTRFQFDQPHCFPRTRNQFWQVPFSTSTYPPYEQISNSNWNFHRGQMLYSSCNSHHQQKPFSYRNRQERKTPCSKWIHKYGSSWSPQYGQAPCLVSTYPHNGQIPYSDIIQRQYANRTSFILPPSRLASSTVSSEPPPRQTFSTMWANPPPGWMSYSVKSNQNTGGASSTISLRILLEVLSPNVQMSKKAPE
ncbi:hypothetical protein NPIL_248831 [Nephila pilipes]|uniref:Uncharacterized protein n=1 Tax=Nephila pilipes TaxID=299642 RepID=A0A8X6U1C8_NEPPI|nr:hypothetical protein NPIL_248831 [Nephila pilipes]